VPALQATRGRLQAGFRITDAGGMRLGKTWTILIIAQVGFAVALLPPAVASAWNDTRDGFAGLGFAAEEFLSVQVGMDLAEGTGFARRQTELQRRLEAESRVSGVAFSMFHPGDEGGARIEAEGAGGLSEVRFNRVDSNFFRTFEVPVLAGRVEGGAVVVNLPLAKKIFGGNALGRRIRYVDKNRAAAAPEAESSRWYEIVGIVADFPTGASPGMRDTEQLKVYHAVAAGDVQPVTMAIRVRGGGPATFAGRLREIAAAVDPELYVREIRGLDDVMRSEQWISRMTAAAFLAITVSVLMLSSAGIHALMSFTVSQRRKEIGIRMALGAGGTQIVASIFGRALLQLAIGAALGAALGAVCEKASGGVLLRGYAAVVVPGVSLVILGVGLMAALGPTVRSLRIEPTVALREQ
jgi:hypothetical protein